MTDEKTKLRRLIALEKGKHTSASLELWSKQIHATLEQDFSFCSAQTVLLYYSLKDEVQTHDLIQKWYRKKTILLPVVQGNDLILRQYQGKNNLIKGAFHIEEPTGDIFTQYDDIDLAIIPGVAFDSSGNRLGRGKGYYDRLLSGINAFKIGICFPFQLIEQVPSKPYDIKMNKVITQ